MEIWFPGGVKDFSHLDNIQTDSGAIWPPMQRTSGHVAGVELLVREADYLSSSNGEVKNTWSSFSIPILFHGVVLNQAQEIFTFLFYLRLHEL